MNSKLPNLIGLGAARSGTTTLAAILAAHPEIYIPSCKKTRFFVDNVKYERGVEWYVDTYFRESEGYKIIGEVTPSYLFQAELTAPRIKSCILDENLKFIVVLRNPVDRAYSHFKFNQNKPYNILKEISFEDALLAEKNSGSRKRVTENYFENGLYSSMIKRFFSLFQEDRFLILLLEDFYPKTYQATTEKIFDFLNVQKVPVVFQKKHSRRSGEISWRNSVNKKIFVYVKKISGAFPKSRKNKLIRKYISLSKLRKNFPEMNLETRKMLTEKYSKDIDELEKIIGRDLSAWK